MRYWARLVCIFSLVAFAIGVVAYSAGTTTMASAMVSAQMSMIATDDCDACGDIDSNLKHAACDFTCNATGVANLPASLVAASPVESSDATVFQLKQIANGIIGPPAKHPPRIYL